MTTSLAETSSAVTGAEVDELMASVPHDPASENVQTPEEKAAAAKAAAEKAAEDFQRRYGDEFLRFAMTTCKMDLTKLMGSPRNFFEAHAAYTKEKLGEDERALKMLDTVGSES